VQKKNPQRSWATKQVVVVLFVIAVVVSVLGTWTVLTEMNSVKIDDPITHATGQLSLTLLEQEDAPTEIGTSVE